MSLTDWGVVVEICFHVSAIFGGICAFIRWGMGQKTTRARYLKVLIGEYNKDVIQDFCIELEQTSSTEPASTEFSMEQAKAMRKTLRFFSYLCQALDAGLINKEEFSFFTSQIRAVLSDSRVRAYVKQDYERNGNDSSVASLWTVAKKRDWLA